MRYAPENPDQIDAMQALATIRRALEARRGVIVQAEADALISEIAPAILKLGGYVLRLNMRRSMTQ